MRTDQREDRSLLAHRPRAIRAPPVIAVAQAGVPPRSKARVESLRLAVTPPQMLRGHAERRSTRPDLSKHCRPPDFLGAHRDPLHVALLVKRGHRGHFY